MIESTPVRVCVADSKLCPLFSLCPDNRANENLGDPTRINFEKNRTVSIFPLYYHHVIHSCENRKGADNLCHKESSDIMKVHPSIVLYSSAKSGGTSYK